MDLGTLLWLLRNRRDSARRDRWTRELLLDHQRRALARLCDFAVQRSPFYRERGASLAGKPLSAWPIVTKAELMANFDTWVTDPGLHLSRLEEWIANADAADHGVRRFGPYVVTLTAGTTGRRGIFLADPSEWRAILGSYVRVTDWADVSASLTHRLRLAVVSSTNPWHQSAAVGAALKGFLVPTLRLDATRPVAELVSALNQFQPESLVAYASMARPLAEEQLAGRLRIAPRAVTSASEVLGPLSRARVREAFGVDPLDTYVATETATIAAECPQRRRHVFEDYVIVENLDDRGAPVPVGELGSRTVVTVLFSRTQPLIRYELSDQIRLLAGTCSCGRPFALFGEVEGRREDQLLLSTASGPVTIHPNVFHDVLDPLPTAGWQVRQEERALRVLLTRSAYPLDAADIAGQIERALAHAGAAGQRVTAEFVEAIPRTTLGKAPLIQALRPG